MVRLTFKFSKPSRRALYAIATVLQIFWGVMPAVSKLAISEVPPELCGTLRWSLASTILVLFLFFSRGWALPLKKEIFWPVILGFMDYGIASVAMLYGIKMGGVIHFALVTTFNPVLFSIASIVILKERPKKVFYIALSLGVFGLLLIVFGKYKLSTLSIAMGSLAVILVAQSMDALTFACSKKFKKNFTTLEFMALTQISGVIFMWFLQFFFFHQWEQIPNLSWESWVFLAFLAVGGVGCYGVLYWLLNHMEGHKIALFDGVFALSAVMLGHFLFQEPMDFLMAIGAGLVLVSIFLGNKE